MAVIINRRLGFGAAVIAAVFFMTLVLLSRDFWTSRPPATEAADAFLSQKVFTAAECAAQGARKAGSKPSSGVCNPMMHKGYIDLQSSNAWTVYNYPEKCPPITKADIPQLREHLRNRRVYFYGDSVNRNAHETFCSDLGSKVESYPDPPGYRTTSDRQGIHICRIPELNFTSINTYTFGLHAYSEGDVPFLTAHASINHKSGHDTPDIWTFENRMMTPIDTLKTEFGGADMIVISSGVWDLVTLQQHIMRDFREKNIPQGEAPPREFMTLYADRLTKYIRLARALHVDTLKKMYFLPLHRPAKLDFEAWWGMDGLPKEGVVYSGTNEFRVNALNDLHYSVVEAEGAADLGIIPFDRLIRGIPEGAPESELHKTKDDIHPSEFANSLLTLAILGEARAMGW